MPNSKIYVRQQPSPAKLEAQRAETLVATFQKLWESLFTTPVHLDSALSKLTKSQKSILAQIVPKILLRPASEAEAYGIGMGPDEPWSHSSRELSQWRSAALIFERMYEVMSKPARPQKAQRSDFPPRLISEWQSTWGPEVADRLAQTLGEEPPLSLRASTRLGSEKLLKELSAGGALPVKAEVSLLSPVGVRLAGYVPIMASDPFTRGDFEIQDEGSQIMALFALWPEQFKGLLQSVPGPVKFPAVPIGLPVDGEGPAAPQIVVDACAGAGGKSLALGDLMSGKGRVYAYDTSEKKLQALRRRATRAGLNNIQSVTVQDGKEDETLAKFRGSADLVLVDAPCSGWGVLRRNPDIKWRQDPEVQRRMPEIQLRLLKQYAELVKPGGRLVFGVCTFAEAETRGLVERFLAEKPEFQRGAGGYLGPGPCDGFFMQAFIRR